MEIRRCRHIKINGTQCGSPALRGQCYCYFHNNCRRKLSGAGQRGSVRLPVLEDANSIQAALMQVIRLMLAKQIGGKEAGLLLYALQIASSNLHGLRLQPLRDEIVVDPLLVAHSPLGGNPVRQEDFEAESDEEQEVFDKREERLVNSQRQAEAEWEQEARVEFSEMVEEAENGGEESPKVADAPAKVQPRYQASPELIARLRDAGARYKNSDPKLFKYYEEACASLEVAGDVRDSHATKTA